MPAITACGLCAYCRRQVYAQCEEGGGWIFSHLILLNIIGLLDAPSSGNVPLAGRDVSALPDDARSVLRRDLLGFVFQNYYLLPELTVRRTSSSPSACGARSEPRIGGA